MEKYIPDIYQKSIYTINYQKLWNQGIKCLLFDLDNTLVFPSVKEPTEEVKELFNKLKKMGFKVIIFSNSPKSRVKAFKEGLEVDCSASSRKPRPNKFYLVLSKYNFTINELAIIGDQILTDVLGGNRVGILTILVDPLTKRDMIWTKFNRIIEKRVIKKLSKKSILIKGKYYE